VAYSPAVKAAQPDVLGFINLFVAETNQAYANSGIDARVVLARTLEARGYVESGTLEGDLSAFGGLTSPWRARYENTVDVMLFLTTSTDLCGAVYYIPASSVYQAYGVVSLACATGNYTPAHEIGHLFGARHNTDANTSPFPYGHGYVSPTNAWKTIMSTSTSCGGCPRIPYFSNPDRYEPTTSEAMGTVDTADVARVHNERIATVAAFELLRDTVLVGDTDVDTLKEGEFSDIQAARQVRILPPGGAGQTGLRIQGGSLKIRVGSNALGKRAPSFEPAADGKVDGGPHGGLRISQRFSRQGLELSLASAQPLSAWAKVYDLGGRQVGARRLEGMGPRSWTLPGAWFQGDGRILRVTAENGSPLIKPVILSPRLKF
jgi:hypothetical protein